MPLLIFRPSSNCWLSHWAELFLPQDIGMSFIDWKWLPRNNLWYGQTTPPLLPWFQKYVSEVGSAHWHERGCKPISLSCAWLSNWIIKHHVNQKSLFQLVANHRVLLSCKINLPIRILSQVMSSRFRDNIKARNLLPFTTSQSLSRSYYLAQTMRFSFPTVIVALAVSTMFVGASEVPTSPGEEGTLDYNTLPEGRDLISGVSGSGLPCIEF